MDHGMSYIFLKVSPRAFLWSMLGVSWIGYWLMPRLEGVSLILAFSAVGAYNVKNILNDMTKFFWSMLEVSTLSKCQGYQDLHCIKLG